MKKKKRIFIITLVIYLYNTNPFRPSDNLESCISNKYKKVSNFPIMTLILYHYDHNSLVQ